MLFHVVTATSESSQCPISLPVLGIILFLHISQPHGAVVISHGGFDLISLVTNDVEPLSMSLQIPGTSLGKCLCRPSAHLDWVVSYHQVVRVLDLLCQGEHEGEPEQNHSLEDGRGVSYHQCPFHLPPRPFMHLQHWSPDSLGLFNVKSCPGFLGPKPYPQAQHPSPRPV